MCLTLIYIPENCGGDPDHLTILPLIWGWGNCHIQNILLINQTIYDENIRKWNIPYGRLITFIYLGTRQIFLLLFRKKWRLVPPYVKFNKLFIRKGLLPPKNSSRTLKFSGENRNPWNSLKIHLTRFRQEGRKTQKRTDDPPNPLYLTLPAIRL